MINPTVDNLLKKLSRVDRFEKHGASQADTQRRVKLLQVELLRLLLRLPSRHAQLGQAVGGNVFDNSVAGGIGGQGGDG